MISIKLKTQTGSRGILPMLLAACGRGTRESNDGSVASNTQARAISCTAPSRLRARAMLCTSLTVFVAACGGGSGVDAPPSDATQTLAKHHYTIATTTTTAAPIATLSPTALDFGSVPIGTSSAILIVTITNTGTANLSFPVDFVLADSHYNFGGTGTCATGIDYAPGSSCTGSVVFKPTAEGTQAGSLTISSNATASPQTVALTGNGVTTSTTTTSTTTTSTATTSTTTTSTTTPTTTTTTTPTTTNNYYVATTGSDSNSGTQTAPFKTILKASQVAKPDTTIHVAAGTYAGGFQTTVSGTASGRIYYVSDTKWGAKIVPSSSTSSDTLWDNRGDYITIVGFEVDGTNGSANWLNGIYTGGSYSVIKNNHVHHIAKNVTPSGAGGSGIGTDNYYGGVSDDVIANVVHDIGPATGTGIQGIYISTNGNVNNNLVYAIQDTCLHTWHNANHVNFVNNTVFNCINGAGVIVGGGGYYNGYSAGNDYTNVSNNIVYDSAYGIVENGTTGTHNTYTNNLVYKNTQANWSLHNGLVSSATVTADPQFVNYVRTGGGDYHLQSTSPAIGAGSSATAPSTDIDGALRGTPADIGAYKH